MLNLILKLRHKSSKTCIGTSLVNRDTLSLLLLHYSNQRRYRFLIPLLEHFRKIEPKMSNVALEEIWMCTKSSIQQLHVQN